MEDNELTALEQLIEKYPWYSLAHLELYKKISEQGPEARKSCLGRASAYVHSRELLYEIAALHDMPSPAVNQEIELPEENPAEVSESFVEDLIEDHELDIDSEPEQKTAEVVQEDEDFIELIEDGDEEIIVVDSPKIIPGGDYFSRNEMESLDLDSSRPIDKFIAEKPSLLRGSSPAADPVVIDIQEEFDDSGFYTETLAAIYAEQGFVKRALDVYAKLILLYPEKSVYFASLVKELKTKHNT